MGTVIYQPRYVILRHLGKLFLEYTFQPGQYDQAFSCIVVVDDTEFDLAIALFENSRLKRTISLGQACISIDPYMKYLLRKGDNPRFTFGVWGDGMRVGALDAFAGTFAAQLFRGFALDF